METLDAMLGGPGRLRFIVQPLVAILLGIRDGRLDARAGLPPYIIVVLFVPELRRENLKSALQAVAKTLVAAIVIDMILQYLIFQSVRLWLAVVVGAALIALPYSAARGLTNRVVRRRMSPGPGDRP